MEENFTNADWALFRSKLPAWQEAYMEKLNQEYVGLLLSDSAASDKFWKLDERLREDKRKVGVRIEMTRSKFFYNLSLLLSERVIGPDDLNEFSDDVKAALMPVYEGKTDACSDA